LRKIKRGRTYREWLEQQEIRETEQVKMFETNRLAAQAKETLDINKK
jgi:hypothetical protein